jgi:hypothetical protein
MCGDVKSYIRFLKELFPEDKICNMPSRQIFIWELDTKSQLRVLFYQVFHLFIVTSKASNKRSLT